MDKKIMIQMMRQGERWNKIDMKMERFLMKLKKEGMCVYDDDDGNDDGDSDDDDGDDDDGGD